MSDTRFSAVFTYEGGELKGRVRLPAEDTVTLEVLATLVNQFSEKTGYPVQEVLHDIWHTTRKL